MGLVDMHACTRNTRKGAWLAACNPKTWDNTLQNQNKKERERERGGTPRADISPGMQPIYSINENLETQEIYRFKSGTHLFRGYFYLEIFVF